MIFVQLFVIVDIGFKKFGGLNKIKNSRLFGYKIKLGTEVLHVQEDNYKSGGEFHGHRSVLFFDLWSNCYTNPKILRPIVMRITLLIT